MLRKSQPDFSRYVKKIEAQVKNGFLIKTTGKCFKKLFDFVHYTFNDSCSHGVTKFKYVSKQLKLMMSGIPYVTRKVQS